MAYFTNSWSNNRTPEAINSLVEIHRRVARGFRERDYYCLRMLLRPSPRWPVGCPG
jgi:transposase